MKAQRLGTWNWNLSIDLNEDWTKFSSPNMDIKNKNNIKVPRRQLNKSAQQDTERECLAPILHQRPLSRSNPQYDTIHAKRIYGAQHSIFAINDFFDALLVSAPRS